jgi:hypothetical protein
MPGTREFERLGLLAVEPDNATYQADEGIIQPNCSGKTVSLQLRPCQKR